MAKYEDLPIYLNITTSRIVANVKAKFLKNQTFMSSCMSQSHTIVCASLTLRTMGSLNIVFQHLINTAPNCWNQLDSYLQTEVYMLGWYCRGRLRFIKIGPLKVYKNSKYLDRLVLANRACSDHLLLEEISSQARSALFHKTYLSY